jgi:hypothetical protein
MSLFSNTYNAPIASATPHPSICIDCGAKNQITITKYANVFHFWYFPMLGFTCINHCHCSACGFHFEIFSLPPNEQAFWKQFIPDKRIPIWYYSGIILIALILIYLPINATVKANQKLTRFESNPTHQVIEYQTEEGNYTSVQTLQTQNDSIWVKFNRQTVKRETDFPYIKDQQHYGEPQLIPLSQLTRLISEERVTYIYSY